MPMPNVFTDAYILSCTKCKGFYSYITHLDYYKTANFRSENEKYGLYNAYDETVPRYKKRL